MGNVVGLTHMTDRVEVVQWVSERLDGGPYILDLLFAGYIEMPKAGFPAVPVYLVDEDLPLIIKDSFRGDGLSSLPGSRSSSIFELSHDVADISPPGTMNLSLPQRQIKEFCRRWKIIDLSVFGSALRDDFRDDSDIDALVGFDEEAQWSLFDLVTMQDELAAIVGRDVDLLTRRGVEESHNPVRREAILSSARSIYKAA